MSKFNFHLSNKQIFFILMVLVAFAWSLPSTDESNSDDVSTSNWHQVDDMTAEEDKWASYRKYAKHLAKTYG